MPGGVAWSPQEDERLRQLVSDFGDKRWSLIAAKLGSKESKQCRRRWKNCLSLELKKGSWTQEEDSILRRLHEIHGNRWTLIARLVGGRTDNAVKNRWAALLKRKTSLGRRGRRPSAHSKLRAFQKDSTAPAPRYRRRGRRAKVLPGADVGEEPSTGLAPEAPAEQALVNPPSTVVDGCSSENDVPVPLGMDHVSDLEDVLLDNLLGPTSIPATDGLASTLSFPLSDTTASDFTSVQLALGAGQTSSSALDMSMDTPLPSGSARGWCSDQFADSSIVSPELSVACQPAAAGTSAALEVPMAPYSSPDVQGLAAAPGRKLTECQSSLPYFTHNELDMLITALDIA